jgi:two-component system response regulator (stage 0 sporulation protein F)
MDKKILIVDDEEKIRTLLEKFLTKKGYQALTATNGQEAIEKVKTDSPLVVLLDIRMPGMDGLAAMKKIKEVSPKTGVIMITGVKDEEVAKKAMELEAFDYITKPFDLNYLETCLMVKLALLET